jgi:hypothetical protein
LFRDLVFIVILRQAIAVIALSAGSGAKYDEDIKGYETNVF